MRGLGRDILIGFQRKWRRTVWLEIFLLALGPAVLVHFLFGSLQWTFTIYLLLVLILLIIKKPWRISLEQISAYIDQKLDSAEYSTGLLLLPKEGLTGLAQVQQHKTANLLREQIRQIQPENQLRKVMLFTIAFITIGIVWKEFGFQNHLKPSPEASEPLEVIPFMPVDSILKQSVSPELVDAQLSITYPSYTGLPALRTSDMNIKAVEGSYISWRIRFEGAVDSVSMERMGKKFPMKKVNRQYERGGTIGNSGFYNFRFLDTLGRPYLSELFSIEVLQDEAPLVEIQGLDLFSAFEVDEEKRFKFKTTIKDDYGIAGAYIIATVSKGSGEAVKFREERLQFDDGVAEGEKELDLRKEIDLDDLKMEAGDELYFYVEAFDAKSPNPNRSRSETYFAVIKDTTSSGFAVEATMGVDLMPAYFRSQRQLIIDTEKLISRKSELTTEAYNAHSNNLGFDQKVLRLRYGQFMGDESESELQENSEADSDHEHNEEDPLAAYSHRHDGDNEHNLVAEDLEKGDEGEDANDPLRDYLHNHSDPEESTLFTESLKSKLRQALNEMWEAELQLRLYEPQKSLPYQYRALDLIQEIKNSARIYVHRIGFDPPPIKEDSRLTGEIEEVRNYQKVEELEGSASYPFLRAAINRLEEIISMHMHSRLSKEDQLLFEKAGEELASKAIEEPGKYLESLQQLKRIAELGEGNGKNLAKLQRDLSRALPKPEPRPGRAAASGGELNDLLLKELELHD